MKTVEEWHALGVRCPRCLEGLVEDAAGLICVKCHVTYPVHFDIPDLRTGEDPYLTKEQDLAAAQALAARASTMDFRALLASYYATNDKVPPAQVALFTHGTIAALERAESTLSAWMQHDKKGAAREAATVLDLGCGTAPLAIAAQKKGLRAIGVDVGLRWLVLAQHRAREAGVDLPLVCANAELLPFRDAAVSRVGGESILENSADPNQMLHEIARVLGRGGRLWLTTPNKRSLGPDPHLGVMAGGWWPEAWLKRHAARTGKVFPRRTLYTQSALRRALQATDFAQITIELPDVARSQKAMQSIVMQGAIAGYQIVKRLPIARTLLRSVAPTYLVTATRV